MCAEVAGPTYLALRVAWEDADLIEVETRVKLDGWSGLATVYAESAFLQGAARDLRAWSKNVRETLVIETGTETALPYCGFLKLSFYPLDRRGHVACHIQFMTRAVADRPEAVRRLSLELTTELGLVDRFMGQLQALAESRKGEAVLEGVQR